ncbi:MAG: DUF4832 domain-containing protein [Lachnospiraceae bacterium]|nr:DUF4832 domain-containing protein [Lachnospiraceae bacterium]
MKTISKRLLFMLFSILLFILLFLIVVFPTFFEKDILVNLKSESFVESSDSFANPYQGWYRIYTYLLADNQTITKEQIAESLTFDPDTRLALLEINLKEYQNCPISSDGLIYLDSLFSAWSSSNKQLIVRFLYDWDSNATKTEPANIDQICEHMTQVSEVVNRYHDHIYILQGIFVGNYGEMNNSSYLSNKSIRLLMEHLASVTDPSIYLSVRTPAHWRTINQTFRVPDKKEAFSDTILSRVGLFNDGMLGSANDLGTYGDLPYEKLSSYEEKAIREDEINFQNKLCEYVPNGGEVVLDNPCNDLETAIHDLISMHVSYLNCDYDTSVLNKWKSTVYKGADAVFGDKNGYEYVGEHLGYRYVLCDLQLNDQSDFDQETELILKIKNAGFANSLRKFKPELLLENKKTSKQISIPLKDDPRLWKSGEETDLHISLPIREYEKGTYHIYFKLSDPATKEIIRFANTLPLSKQGYKLGELTIEK